jgi:demethoxyubiquinone hydroxylase (CLK1/Coq7/Cat5 family)
MATTNIDTLNSLLRGEISAVETYDQAIARLTDDAIVAQRLQECRRSHEQRVALLREEVARAGGDPAHGSGAWGGFAKLVEGGAKLFGKKAAIAALEEGEDHGLRQYRHDLPKLDPETRRELEPQLLREQEQTHHALSELKHALKS